MIDLRPRLGQQAAAYEGKDIVFGFRPEAIVLGTPDKDSAVISGTVELTEMLGDNANVYVDVDADKVILKVSPHEIPEMDSRVCFSIPNERIYLFDAQTEMTL